MQPRNRALKVTKSRVLFSSATHHEDPNDTRAKIDSQIFASTAAKIESIYTIVKANYVIRPPNIVTRKKAARPKVGAVRSLAISTGRDGDT